MNKLWSCLDWQDIFNVMLLTFLSHAVDFASVNEIEKFSSQSFFFCKCYENYVVICVTLFKSNQSIAFFPIIIFKGKAGANTSGDTW